MNETVFEIKSFMKGINWPLGGMGIILKELFSSSLHEFDYSAIHMKLPSEKCHLTPLVISQHWFRQWLDAVRQEAIIWANAEKDPCRHMVSRGLNGLRDTFLVFILFWLVSSVNLRHTGDLGQEISWWQLIWSRKLHCVWSNRWSGRSPQL